MGDLECNQDGCSFRCRIRPYMKRHLWQKHSIGSGKIYTCDVRHCSYMCKFKGDLTRHAWQVHNIGRGNVFHCNLCDYTSKRRAHIRRHMIRVHLQGGPVIVCDHCQLSFGSKEDLNWHIRNVHRIDIGIVYECHVVSCKYRCKKQAYLSSHLWQVHDIGSGKIYECSQCTYTCKRLYHLNRHMEARHDIGKYICDICQYGRNSKVNWLDQTNTTLSICKRCHSKLTKKHRIEHIWNDYINEHVPSTYDISYDQSLKSIGGCSMKRPDRLVGSSDLVELDECDEHQHLWKNGDYLCEEERISEIYDEPSICGKRMVVIRWNPHHYTVPVGETIATRQYRLQLMVTLKLHLRKSPPPDLITVYYICYSKDNPRIVQSYPFHLIYSISDIERL